jgi:hypothetical protein
VFSLCVSCFARILLLHLVNAATSNLASLNTFLRVLSCFVSSKALSQVVALRHVPPVAQVVNLQHLLSVVVL